MPPDSESRWIPLESNPDVFNSWATKAGLIATQARFEDIYGLDPELLALVPQPVLAVTLLFPQTKEMESFRLEEQSRIAEQGQHAVDPTIFWIKQTISNACGTMGLIHSLANSRVALAPHSPLAQFIDNCKDKTPQERAKYLETTPLFADIHANAASSGQTAVPTDLFTELHFTCFVLAPDAEARKDGSTTAPKRLIELDGDLFGPTDRGECDDLLEGVASFVKKYYISRSSSTQFSMMALYGVSS